MVVDLRYFNSLEHEVDFLKSQLETQKTQFLNEIDRLSREYYYADHMNAILGVYTTLDEFTNLQCDYVDQVVKYERLEKELSKRTNNVNNKSFNELSKRFSELEQYSINLELALQQDLKAQLQDKDIAISELKKLIEKMKGKSVETNAQILPQNVKSILKNTNVIASGMYKVHTNPNQTRTPQLPQDIRKTNKHISFFTGLISTTSVSRSQLKSNQLEDRVMHNNNQGKKQQVEDHHRSFKFPNNKISVTACNDSLNAKTSNVNFFCVTCGKCVLNDNHDMYVLHYINGVNSRTKMPMVVPINTREPKRTVNQSAVTPLKRTVVIESTNQKPRSIIRKQYEQISKTCKWLYWLNHNLFSVGQFYDADLEVAFRKSTCYIRDLKGNDLLTGSRGTDLYSITHQDTSTPNLICLMAKATSSQAWLWHRHLSHLKFDTINLLSMYDIVTGLPKLKFVKDHLCSSCELGKAKQKSFYTKTTLSSKRRLQLLHMDLCGPMRVESINGKKYVLVIIDDYSRYTWTHFLRSKEETPEVLIDFLKLVQKGLHAQVRTVQTDKAISIACFTQNRSLIIPRHEKTPYHIINGWKPFVKFFHIFGSLCYIVKDGENLEKIKEKGNACIFVGYSTQSRAYRMVSDHVSYDPVPQCPTTALEHASLSTSPQSQKNVPHSAKIVTTSNEMVLLFSLMFNELLNGTTPVVSKSSAVTAADAPNQCQQQHTTPSTSTTVAANTPPLNIQTTPTTTSQASLKH
ncbi:retrovirus-related pol polyprotein from transposon TNT 1-94 [Tanacetum coccineum]